MKAEVMSRNSLVKISWYYSLAIVATVLITLSGCGSSSDDPQDNPPPPGVGGPGGPGYPGGPGVQRVCVPTGNLTEFPIGFQGPARIDGNYAPWLCAGTQPGYSLNCAASSTPPLALTGPVGGGTFYATSISGGRIYLNIAPANQNRDTSVTGTVVITGPMLSTLQPLPTFGNPWAPTTGYSGGACITGLALSFDVNGYPSVPQINSGWAFLQIEGQYHQSYTLGF